MRRTNNEIARDQSKLTGKFVVVYECERWGNQRKSGWNIYKDGKFIETIYRNLNLKAYMVLPEYEWMDVKKSK